MSVSKTSAAITATHSMFLIMKCNASEGPPMNNDRTTATTQISYETIAYVTVIQLSIICAGEGPLRTTVSGRAEALVFYRRP